MKKKKYQVKGELELSEKTKLANIDKRVDEAMKAKGIGHITELSDLIVEKRGFCPAETLYTKLKKAPEGCPEGFYNMSIKNLFLIAEALGVSTDYLLGRTKLMQTTDKLKANSLGLTNASLNKLNEWHTISVGDTDDTPSLSTSCHEPQRKALRALNWIIEHTDICEDQNNYKPDFLTTMHHLIMLFFESTREMRTEAVLNDIMQLLDNEHDKYEELLDSYQNVVMESDEKERTRIELVKARQNYIHNKSMNDIKRSILSDIIDGVVSASDPLTHDHIKINVSDPFESLMKDLRSIISDWRREYQKVYEKKREKQRQEHEEWLKSIHNTKAFYDSKKDEFDINILEDTYIPPYMRDMTTDEQKKYFLLLYLEEKQLKNMIIHTDGKVTFSSTEISQVIKTIQNTDDDKTGLYLNDDGDVMYSEERAMNPEERAKLLFERYNLPCILDQWLRDPTRIFITNGYFDEYNYYMYRTQEEADNLISKAERTGASYTVKNGVIKVQSKPR